MLPSAASTNCSSAAWRELCGARVDLAGERLLRGGAQRLAFGTRGRGVGGELEAGEPADRVALDDHFAGFGDFGFEHRVLAQPPHQHAGAAVDEALGETLVQRVGQPVLDAARDALPVLGIGEPVRAVCRKGPGPDVGDPVRERIDIAVGAVRLRNLRGEPVGRNCTLPHQEIHRGWRQLGMGGRRDLAIVRNLADLPQPLDRGRAMWPNARTSSSRETCSSTWISSAIGARVRPCSVGVCASDAASAPSEEKSSALLRHCSTFTESKVWLSSACASSGSNGGQRPVVPNVPSRMARPARPGDLAELGGIELAELIAVELAVGGERHVIDVEIEPMPIASVATR